MSPDIIDRTRVVPHHLIEYGYYFSIFYGLMGAALGLHIGGLGSGLVAGLAVLCLFTLGSRTMVILTSIGFPLGCAVSFIIVQWMWHGEPLMADYLRPFITWMFSLVIVQSLVLRKGFLHRFTVAIFLMGLALLPFLSVYLEGEEFQRMGLEKESGVGLANPTAFAAWFGFCSIYFSIFGLTTKQNVYRVLAWLLALVCFILIALTVSRAALFGAAIAIVVASRHYLRKVFWPILVLAVMSFGVLEFGVFDDVIHSYSARMKEGGSGRFLVWPLAIKGFLESPFVGVGISEVGIFVPRKQKLITPHNGFLFLAFSSGIVPLAFFVAYWIRAFWRSFHQYIVSRRDAPFLMPMFVYAFLIMLQGNLTFMEPWAIIGVAMVMTAGRPHSSDKHAGNEIRDGKREN